MFFIIHFFTEDAVELKTHKLLICHILTDDFRFTDLSYAPVVLFNPFSQYQNSHCEETVMNLTVFYARQLESN